MKLKFVIILFMIASVVAAAGCSIGQDSKAEQIELVIHTFYTDYRVNMLQAAVDHYSADSGKEVSVRFETIPDDYDRLKQLEKLYNSGEQVDLLWVPGTISHSELALREYAHPLGGYISPLDLVDYFIDVSRFEFAGQLYAMPLRWNEYVIFYNKDLFDQYLIPYPYHEWTYEELADKAYQLTIPEEGVMGIQHGSSLFFTVGGAYAGASFDAREEQLVLNSEEALAGFRFLVDQFRYNKIDGRVGEDLSQGYIAEPEFFDGHVAMSIGTTTAYRTMREHVPNVGMAPFPRGAVSQLGLSELDSLAISTLSEYKDDAFELLRYLTGDTESAAVLVQNGFTLPLLDDERLFAEWREFYGDENVETIEYILQNNDHNFGFPLSVPGYANMLAKTVPLLLDTRRGLYSGRYEVDEQFVQKIETINLEWQLELAEVWQPLYDRLEGH